MIFNLRNKAVADVFKKGQYNFDIPSCVTCKYYQSYYDEYGQDDDMPKDFGQCRHEDLENKVFFNFGIDVVCDIWESTKKQMKK